MAEEEMSAILLDLQKHLKTANVKVTNLSTIAQNGDEKLVEKFMSETIFVKAGDNSRDLAESKTDVLQSQLYVACFWGFKSVVNGILDLSERKGLGVDVNAQNRGTLWTPLHAATFQEHGPIIMILLEKGANPELNDSEGRSPKDFAAASDKVWGHFAAQGLKRTPKSTLIQMGIIKKIFSGTSGALSPRSYSAAREPGSGIRMAAYSRPESAYAYNSDPFITAAVTGDVLAGDEDIIPERSQQPQFAAYK